MSAAAKSTSTPVTRGEDIPTTNGEREAVEASSGDLFEIFRAAAGVSGIMRGGASKVTRLIGCTYETTRSRYNDALNPPGLR